MKKKHQKMVRRVIGRGEKKGIEREENWREMVQNHGQDIAERICWAGRRTTTVGRKLESEVKGKER